ncbi:MAG: GntR family transcriptional regulator [Clostridia bacterium]|jgi:DNA-binding GntR family transcriptional regulator|nr:GntR family transcriptional regulator [Clostridia bacterium]MDD4571975.1 GntR family transcriptional regulator [Clostridia bacterium]
MGREKLSPIRLEGYQPLREMVFEVLREAIMSGQLPPGERLMEVQLAEEMGVSRTPVREAIRRLELDGFVVMVPRKGAYVAGMSVKDIISVFEIRTSLERLAASLAAERMSEAELEDLERLLVELSETWEEGDVEHWAELDSCFHEQIYNATKNDRLVQIMNNIFEQINRYRMICLAQTQVRQNSLEEHKKLLEAIAERNPAKAKVAASEHIENTQNSLLEILRDKLGELD